MVFLRSLIPILMAALLVFLVVGLCLASADPASERSQKWGAFMWAFRWFLPFIILAIYLFDRLLDYFDR